MVKHILLLGLLASSLAFISAAPASDEPHAHPGVKTFAPDLRSRANFNIYDDPISITATPKSLPVSLSESVKENGALQDKVKTAISYLNTKHSIPSENVQVTAAYTDQSSGITHVYVRQVVKELEVTNAVGGVNINRDGKVVSSSHSFAPAQYVDQVQNSQMPIFPEVDDAAAIKAALKALTDYVQTSIDSDALGSISISPLKSHADDTAQFTIINIPKNAAIDGSAAVKKSLIQKSDGSLAPVWSFTLEQQSDWWSAEVSATAGKVVSINNWYSSADASKAMAITSRRANPETFNVFPRTIDTPLDGGRQMVSNPAILAASPIGWVNNETTIGNNVWAQDNPTGGDEWQNNHRPHAPGNVFDFPLDLTQQPPSYIDASITQLFYTNNVLHDLSFLYGFNEAAGNFQDVNFSGDGKGGDGVIANAQDGSGTNNANFATPPDGQRPRMRMFVWTKTNPRRDGDLEQNIVAHEYTHGISNRLTGGPANTNCLNRLESGGMGEGWSDTVANLLRIKPGDTRTLEQTLGQYSNNANIRRFPYSTNLSRNPSRFGFLDRADYQEVHAVGEVWASMLYEVIWNIIENNSNKISDLFDHDLTAGNSVSLQLILNGMKLQPCNPNFLQARDAILQADKNMTGNKNRCAIWKGFAKRGLGVNASEFFFHFEDFSVPSDC